MKRFPLSAAVLALLLPSPLAAAEADDRMVDVGGHSLRARLLGKGSPAVVFDSGGGGAPLESWGRLPELVAERCRVVLYDRAGVGGSGRGPEPRTGERVARELHALLEGLGVEPPYVLVGHSLGGLHIRFFASLYPGEVAGFVFVDPTTEDMRPRLETETDRLRFDAQLGQLSEGPRAEMSALAANVDAVARLGAPPDRPAVVLTATALPEIPLGEREAMRAAGITEAVLRALRERAKGQHARLAARFPRGRQVEAAGSGHAVHLEEPELVRDEVLKVVDAARTAR